MLATLLMNLCVLIKGLDQGSCVCAAAVSRKVGNPNTHTHTDTQTDNKTNSKMVLDFVGYHNSSGTIITKIFLEVRIHRHGKVSIDETKSR